MSNNSRKFKKCKKCKINISEKNQSKCNKKPIEKITGDWSDQCNIWIMNMAKAILTQVTTIGLVCWDTTDFHDPLIYSEIFTTVTSCFIKLNK